MNYTNMTNEELVSIITESADNGAYDQLFRNLAPNILHEAEMYRGKMVTYDTEDFLQEGLIVAWQIIERGNFKRGRFAVYFGSAIRKRLVNIYRDYTLKKPDLHQRTGRLLGQHHADDGRGRLCQSLQGKAPCPV